MWMITATDGEEQAKSLILKNIHNEIKISYKKKTAPITFAGILFFKINQYFTH
jgi:hypothetical protein